MTILPVWRTTNKLPNPVLRARFIIYSELVDLADRLRRQARIDGSETRTGDRRHQYYREHILASRAVRILAIAVGSPS